MSPVRVLAAFGAATTAVAVVAAVVTFTVAFLLGGVFEAPAPDLTSYYEVVTVLFLVGVTALTLAYAVAQASRTSREATDRRIS